MYEFTTKTRQGAYLRSRFEDCGGERLFNEFSWYGRLAKKYGLKISTVSFFVRWYKENYEHLKANNEPTEPSLTKDQGQLDDANLKITALELLIENASKELGVDLVKKFGTKQSHK